MLLEEISTSLGGGGRRGRSGATQASGRRGRRATRRLDGVFSRLPKGSFKANDVRSWFPTSRPARCHSDSPAGSKKETEAQRIASRHSLRQGRLTASVRTRAGAWGHPRPPGGQQSSPCFAVPYR